jgi:hypothetical protein
MCVLSGLPNPQFGAPTARAVSNSCGFWRTAFCIAVAETAQNIIGVNTEDDLRRLEAYFQHTNTALLGPPTPFRFVTIPGFSPQPVRISWCAFPSGLAFSR